MAPTIEDRWLWLGLGVFTFVAVKGVAYGLRNIVQLTEVHKPPPLPPIPLPNGKEDAIKTSSLQTLATCSNVEIRKAATKILCQRFIEHPSARDILVKDLRSDDPEIQHRAQLAFDLLNDYNVFQQTLAPPDFSAVLGLNGTSRRPMPRWRPSTTRSSINRDPVERDLRRRRREAMVLNEGDRPVSQEDVWMRDGEGLFITDAAGMPSLGVFGAAMTDDQSDSEDPLQGIATWDTPIH